MATARTTSSPRNLVWTSDGTGEISRVFDRSSMCKKRMKLILPRGHFRKRLSAELIAFFGQVNHVKLYQWGRVA